MTRYSNHIVAIAAALLLTLVTFQQAVSVPSAPAPVGTVQLA